MSDRQKLDTQPAQQTPSVRPDSSGQTDIVTESQRPATWVASDWRGKRVVDCDGAPLGKLQDVYVDVETDAPEFGTIKEGFFFGRHLTFVPLGGVEVGPDALHVRVAKVVVASGPNLDLSGQELTQADESALYHHFEMNYTPITSESGRRLARR